MKPLHLYICTAALAGTILLHAWLVIPSSAPARYDRDSGAALAPYVDHPSQPIATLVDRDATAEIHAAMQDHVPTPSTLEVTAQEYAPNAAHAGWRIFSVGAVCQNLGGAMVESQWILALEPRTASTGARYWKEHATFLGGVDPWQR